jgi:alanine racemase
MFACAISDSTGLRHVMIDGQSRRESRATAPELCVDVDAVCRNFRALQSMSGTAICGAVVKADAYGLGASAISRALCAAGCCHFFVADLDEALALAPRLSDACTVFVLNGLVASVTDEYRTPGIVPTLNSLDEIRIWAGRARDLGCRLPAAIQIDTGMSRFGLSPKDVDWLASTDGALDGLELRLVLSHLARADEPTAATNDCQRRSFEQLRRKLPPAPGSLANSAAILLGPAFHFELVRPGIALYGVQPALDSTLPIEAVVQLSATVRQVRSVAAATAIGYGASYSTDSSARIATVGMGYADGILRSLGNRGAAWFGDTRLPIVGAISMDSFTVDASALPDGALVAGCRVDLIGRHQSANDLAEAADTNGYEVLTSLGGRPRTVRTHYSSLE